MSPGPDPAGTRHPGAARTPSRRSFHGLDALVFFVADAQTGFGPFVAVYLTVHGWTQGDIGQALSVGSAAAALSQIPGGAVVDRLRDKRLAAAASALAVAAGAVIFATSAAKPAILLAEILHSFASAALAPAVAALSLALVGRAALGRRLGRNARFASLGNGFAAGVLGLCGTYLSSQAVFWVTAAFVVPGLFALLRIAPGDMREADPAAAAVADWRRDLPALLADRRVLAFAGCVALFHVGNAALLPVASGVLAQDGGTGINLVVSACVVVPQAIVALISPAVGRLADRRGVRLVTAAGFAAVPARALLLAAAVGHPWAVVAVQALDGLGAATFGIAVPLVAAQLTRGTNRFNLCLGTLGLAITAGATVSTFIAGRAADAYGPVAAFLILALGGALAVPAAALAAPGGPR